MTRARTFWSGVLLAAAVVLTASPATAQSREAITVRGRWVIEVRNPDGTVVTRREFDNALAPGGASLLAQYLTSGGLNGAGGSPARWVIELGVYGGATSPCQGGTYGTFPQDQCLIVDAGSTPLPTGTSVFPTLSATLGGAQSDQVVLSGLATARVAGQIVFVATRQGSCPAGTAPASCNPAGTVLQFTVHDLVNAQGQPEPLAIAAGQIVQVTVTLSFS